MSMTLIWTCLPAGVRRKSPDETWMAKVSLMVTPRLDGSSTLFGFPEFLDWPKTLRDIGPDGIEFELSLHKGTEAIATQRLRTTVDGPSAPDSDAWRRIFGAQTPVQPYNSPPSDKTQRQGSAPVFAPQPYKPSEIVREIRGIFGKAMCQDLNICDDQVSPLSQLASAGKKNSGQASAINKFVDFHHLQKQPGLPGAQANEETPGPLVASVPADFHQIIAALGSHQHLLRKLGLVFDFELPLGDLPLDPTGLEQSLRVVPINADFTDTLHYAMRTAIDYRQGSSDIFRLFTVASSPPANSRRDKPNPGNSEGGLFALGDKAAIAQENYEHAALSLVQQAKTGIEGSSEFPALLQGGMRVLHDALPDIVTRAAKHQENLEETLQNRKSSRLGGTLEPLLYAEQLTLGVRADVRRHNQGTWNSLCRRLVQYSMGKDWRYPTEQRTLEDEGFVEPAVFKDLNSETQALFTSSNLFEWDGWSLVVPKLEQGTPRTTLLPREALAGGTEPLETTIGVPPDSLEPQRFGHCYAFRARTVFLAGVGLTLDEANEIEADIDEPALHTRPTCCLRVESAKPPVTVRAQDRGWGEAGDIVVLRDADDKRFRTQSFRLHVLPPQIPLDIAEKHGMFDAMSPDDSWKLIDKHRGQLKRDPDSSNEKSIDTETVADRELFTPYLPDPMVTQAVLRLPDDAGIIDMPRFDDLPQKVRGEQLARSCGLVITAGRNGIASRVSGREVFVELTPGRMHTLKLVAKLSPELLALTAVANQDWHEADLLGDDVDKLHKAAAAGETPLLAPSREIRVVYATQRPLVTPAFGRALILPRNSNETSARLADDALTFDRPSTGRIDIYANWDDTIDDPTADGWTTLNNQMHAGGVDIDLEDGKPLDPIELKQVSRSPLLHDFGDTKHHRVSYTVAATSRFVDFYPPEVTSEPGSSSLTSENIVLNVPATAPPAPPDISYVIPTYATDEVKSVRGLKDQHSVHLRGAGLRVYLQRGWFSSGDGEQLALVVETPNTPDTALENVSEWGLNPLHSAAPLPGPLDMAQIWGGVNRIEHWEIESGSVGLVIYDVQWSEEHQLPFVDIEFLSQRAFMPLVRLAFARYQQHAIEGCNLSRIEHADFVPLTPGRAVTIKKLNRTTWKLEMRGYSYVESGTLPTPDTETKTSVVEAQIEVMPAFVPVDDAAWRALGNPVSLNAQSVETWRMHWTGRVSLGGVEYLSRSWRRRLTIREYEAFNADPDILVSDRSRLISAYSIHI